MNNQYSSFIDKRFPIQSQQSLNLRTIFILPTLYTFFLGLLIIVLWIMSVQFLINLGYFLVFLLIGLVILSMMKTYRNLDGITIASADFLPVFAGEIAALEFELQNHSNNDKGQIELVLENSGVSSKNILAKENQNIVITYHPTKRGIIDIPRIKIRTVMPFGFFIAWSYFQTSKQLLVYPKPIFTEFPLANDDKGEDKGRHEIPGHEEIIGVREYQMGDSMNLISWKHLLQRDKFISKVSVETTGGKTLLFTWDQTNKLADDEYRLSQLCGWIVEAYKNNDAFGLKLPANSTAIDSGSAHLQKCLQVLAKY